MPVQINEMTVTVAVQDTQSAANPTSAQQGGGVDNKAIIKQCVDEVMEVLKSKNER